MGAVDEVLARPGVADLRVALLGVVGSRAYGLDNEHSDTDTLGVYVGSSERLLSLQPPLDKHSTFHHTDPDVTLHELGKFMRLCLNGNPSVVELLWLGEYLHQTEVGADLVKLRSCFLAAGRIRDAYLGYAAAQFHRLRERGDGSFGADLRTRTEKHARHLLRLLMQGLELWQTGQMSVRLSPEKADEVIAFGYMVATRLRPLLAEEKLRWYEDRFNALPCALPDRPDVDTLDGWLLRVRRAELVGT